MRYRGPSRYVVRDFYPDAGRANTPRATWGCAEIHVVEVAFGFRACERLENRTVYDEAYWRWRCNWVDMSGSEFEYRVDSPEAVEAEHRRRYTDVGEVPIRRHECVDRHQQWLAGLVTGRELAAELRLSRDDWEDLWARFVDASSEPGRMFVYHRRDGHWLINPKVAEDIREHVADHPHEYRRQPKKSATEQENRSPMSKAHTYLTTAVDALASAMTEKRDWPVDLDESAPRWAELFKQLGEVARWVMQGAVVVRDDAEKLPPNAGRPLAAKAGELVSHLNTATFGRAEVDHRWRAVAATLTRSPVPGTGHGRPTLVAGVVHDAAQAVRQAANERLAAGDIVPVLTAASAVCEAMCGLVMRLAVAVEKREDDYPALAGISRSLRRAIHNPYRDAGERFAAAEYLAEQIMTRWPGRWPNSV